MKDFNSKGTPSMNTLSYERGNTSLITKRVILHNGDDHYKLYESNTTHTTKRLALK